MRNVENWPCHWHNALEIIMAWEGQAVVGMGGETRLLKENDIAVVNVNEIHRIQKSGGDNKLLIILVDAAFCGSAVPDFQYACMRCRSTYHEDQAQEKYNTLKAHVLRLVSWLIEYPGECKKVNIIDCLDELLIKVADSFAYLRYGAGIKAVDEKQAQRYKLVYEPSASQLKYKELPLSSFREKILENLCVLESPKNRRSYSCEEKTH